MDNFKRPCGDLLVYLFYKWTNHLIEIFVKFQSYYFHILFFIS